MNNVIGFFMLAIAAASRASQSSLLERFNQRLSPYIDQLQLRALEQQQPLRSARWTSELSPKRTWSRADNTAFPRLQKEDQQSGDNAGILYDVEFPGDENFRPTAPPVPNVDSSQVTRIVNIPYPVALVQIGTNPLPLLGTTDRPSTYLNQVRSSLITRSFGTNGLYRPGLFVSHRLPFTEESSKNPNNEQQYDDRLTTGSPRAAPAVPDKIIDDEAVLKPPPVSSNQFGTFYDNRIFTNYYARFTVTTTTKSPSLALDSVFQSGSNSPQFSNAEQLPISGISDLGDPAFLPGTQLSIADLQFSTSDFQSATSGQPRNVLPFSDSEVEDNGSTSFKREIDDNLSVTLASATQVLEPQTTAVAQPAIERTSEATPESLNVTVNHEFATSDDVGLSPANKACFATMKDCFLVGAFPFERTTGVDINTCANACISSPIRIKLICLTFIYNTKQSVCDLYAVSGTAPPSKLLTIEKFIYSSIKSACAQLTSNTSSSSTVVASATSAITTSTTTGQTTSLPASNTTSATATTSFPITQLKVCSNDQLPVMQRIDGYHISETDGTQVGGLSEVACALACQDDKTPDGKPQTCLSASYTKSSRLCLLSLHAAAPTQTSILQEDSNAIYYEKTCIERSLAIRCKDVIPRFPQMVLIGFNDEVRTATALDKCIEMCLNSGALYNFACKSGMYYPGEPKENCILNFEDAKEQPDFFIKEDTGTIKVEYFETGNCQVAAQPVAQSSKFQNEANTHRLFNWQPYRGPIGIGFGGVPATVRSFKA